ncbi:MAG TPA: FixH family protein [Fluviicola sp.]|nr:FixH family protein [Fluviicola sp.]
MSWGFKILFLYLGFIALIVTMVGLTMRENVDLVSEDYYQKELEYQEKINTIERTNALGEPLNWSVAGDSLTLDFPGCVKGNCSGSIFFFRPSDSRLDQTITIPAESDTLRQIPLTKLKKGLYHMQISWKAGGNKYYNESIIQIP